MKVYKTITYYKYTYKNGQIDTLSKKKIGEDKIDKNDNYLKQQMNYEEYSLEHPSILNTEINYQLPSKKLVKAKNEVHEYDENGNLIVSSQLKTPVGDLTKQTVYNVERYIIQDVDYFHEAGNKQLRYYERNEEGLVIEFKEESRYTIERKKSLEHVNRTTYKYDANHNIIEINTYIGEGENMEITSKRVMAYNDDSDMIEDTLYDLDNVYKEDAYLVPVFTIKAEVVYHK